MKNDWFCCVCDQPCDPPKTCCNGFECGCMGQPIEPPVCSPECFEFFDYSPLSPLKENIQ